MATRIKKISILIGEDCNFKCKHCLLGDKKNKKGLTSNEICLIVSEINSHNFKSLLFVGGETTFYIKDINKILSGINNSTRKKIKITTNGYFANSVDSAKIILSSFFKLNGVQLSYDVFHKKFLPLKNVKNLYLACKKMKKEFSVILTLKSPLDLYLIKELKKSGEFPIGVQKVLPIGKALKNNIYYKYPSFNKSVVFKKCPGRKEINYICGQGFTTCCSNLIYNNVVSGVVHPSIKEHAESKFNKLMCSWNFKKLAKYLKVSLKNLPPDCSFECNLCEYIFKNTKMENFL